MPDVQIVNCQNCGAAYQLDATYLAQYGGQQSQCHRCQQPFTIPTPDEVAANIITPPISPQMVSGSPVPVLPYMGPDFREQPSGIWREGDRIVAVSGAVFPDRCVKCNAPSDGKPMRRKLYWHEPALFLLVLAGVLIYAIVALCVRKSGTVTVCVCRKHRSQRRWSIFGAWMSLPASIAIWICAGNNIVPELLVPLGIITLLGGVIAGVIGARVVAPAKIDARYLWLKGAGADFLASLPSPR